MFDTPYQTTSMARTGFAQVGLQRLRTMEISGELNPITSKHSILYVPPGAKDVLPFSLPITKVQIPTMESDIIFDGRPLLKQNGEPMRQDAWDHYVRLCVLTAWWMKTPEYDRIELLSGGRYLAFAYTKWVGDMLTRSLGLMEDQSYLLRVILAIWFISQHEPAGADGGGRDQDRILNRASRVIPGLAPTTIREMVGEVPKLNSLEDMLNWGKALIQSPRFDKATVGLMLNLSGYAWGRAYTDQSKAALEYPPIFAAMVYTTLQERGFIKTAMGMALHRITRGDEDKQFVKSINYILRE